MIGSTQTTITEIFTFIAFLSFNEPLCIGFNDNKKIFESRLFEYQQYKIDLSWTLFIDNKVISKYNYLNIFLQSYFVLKKDIKQFYINLSEIILLSYSSFRFIIKYVIILETPKLLFKNCIFFIQYKKEWKNIIFHDKKINKSNFYKKQKTTKYMSHKCQ